jgi:hypothetical protein
VDAYGLGKLVGVADFRDEVIGADPPLVFAKVLVVHQLTIIDLSCKRPAAAVVALLEGMKSK